jgi:hypothetical protein
MRVVRAEITATLDIDLQKLTMGKMCYFVITKQNWNPREKHTNSGVNCVCVQITHGINGT